jgi:hypothetical protein
MHTNTVRAEVNYTGPMNTRPEFFANDHSLDRVNRDPRVVPIVDARASGLHAARQRRDPHDRVLVRLIR